MTELLLSGGGAQLAALLGGVALVLLLTAVWLGRWPVWVAGYLLAVVALVIAWSRGVAP